MRDSVLNMSAGGLCVHFFFLSAGGCTSVVVDFPIGEAEVSVERQEWEGKRGDARKDSIELEDYVEIVVTDRERGILRRGAPSRQD